jgi:hypothetical protein
MKPLTQPPGTPSRLSDSLRHNLNPYALAASAAGVSLLALVQPSEAKIVYAKAHQVIGSNGVYPIDLNHDGVIDFLIQQERFLGSNVLLARNCAQLRTIASSLSNAQHPVISWWAGLQPDPQRALLVAGFMLRWVHEFIRGSLDGCRRQPLSLHGSHLRTLAARGPICWYRPDTGTVSPGLNLLGLFIFVSPSFLF